MIALLVHHLKLKRKKHPWLVWLSGLNTRLRTKGCQFDSQSRHMSGLQARSPVGGAQGAITH